MLQLQPAAATLQPAAARLREASARRARALAEAAAKAGAERRASGCRAPSALARVVVVAAVGAQRGQQGPGLAHFQGHLAVYAARDRAPAEARGRASHRAPGAAIVPQARQGTAHGRR
eukprot:scaffold81411_cov69-Phaeocystis_antarctica.AAC.1